MNTKHIEELLTKFALEVENGDYTQEQLCQKLSAVATEIGQHCKASERAASVPELGVVRRCTRDLTL